MKMKTQLSNRILSLVLTLVMLLGMMPMSVFAADTEEYNLWVGGVQITSENLVIDSTDDSTISGTATYDPDTNTLTLDSFHYTGPGYTDLAAAIYYGGTDALKLTLEGDSTVTQNAPVTIGADLYSHGVYVRSGLIVSGNGSLTAVGGTGDDLYDSVVRYYGVFVESYITVESGTLTGTGGNVSTSGTGWSYGVIAIGDITVKGGTLTGTGGSVSASDYANSFGVVAQGYGIVVKSGTLTGTGGTVSATKEASSYGVASGVGITVESGELTGTGGTVSASNYAESYGVVAENSITLSGGVTVAQGDTQAFYKSPDTTDFTDAVVWYGESDDAYTGAGTRISNADTYYTNNYVRIAPCDHSGNTTTGYTNNQNGTHSLLCSVCNSASETADHTAEVTYTYVDSNQHTATYDCCNGSVLEDHTGGTATCTDKAVCSVCGESYGKIDTDNHTGTLGTPVPDDDSTQHTATWSCCNTTVTENHTAEPAYAPNARDSTKHDVTYSCCGATVTEDHSFTDCKCISCSYECAHETYTDSVCDLCNMTCEHDYTNGICNACNTYQSCTGAGTEGDPYLIANAGNLYWFAAVVNGGYGDVVQNRSAHGKLTEDIVVNKDVLDGDGDLNSGDFRPWTPIGINFDNRYTGTFDGDGHTVSGLYLNDSSANYVGLFGCLCSLGTVQNVGVIDSYFCGYSFVGGVVGESYGTVTGCYNTGTVSGSDTVGGVVGEGSGTVTNCYNTGAVSGGSYVGGVVGYVVVCSMCSDVDNVVVINCYNTGAVSGNEFVGGLVGDTSAGLWGYTVTNCYYLSDSDDGNGGKTAEQFASGEVAYLLGDAWGQTLSGDSKEETPVLGGETVYRIANTGCLSFGEYGYYNDENTVSAPDHNFPEGSNGFCACGNGYQPCKGEGTEDSPYKIANAGNLYWFAAVVNSGYGDVAQNKSAHAILTADIGVNTGVLVNGVLAEDTSAFREWTPIGSSSKKYTGTFDGAEHTISGLYCDYSSTSYVGLFGYVNSGTVQNVGVVDSYFCGYQHVGGVVGWNNGSVTNCYNKGSVTGSSHVGGVVGNYIKGNVEKCYNTGTVSGSSNYVGGVVGYFGKNGAVMNCYNTGTVSGSSYVGGVVGKNDGAVKNCYNTGSVSGSGGYVGGVVGRSSSTTNCYNTGSVSGEEQVGGVVGFSNSTTNCYYLSGCAKDGKGTIQNGIGASSKGSTTADTADKTAAKTADQFKSGEVAYLLNGNQTNIVWYQTCGVGLPAFTGEQVYYGYADCQATGASYSNTELSPDPIDHIYVNGVCTNTLANGERCGDYESATLNDNVYEIGNAGQLMWFAQKVNGGETSINGALTDDIDLEGIVWVAMGRTSASAYTGTFDGKGHTISNLSRNTGTDEGARESFMYYLGANGHIKDVIFDKADVFTQGHAGANASAVVVLRNSGTISGCIVSDSRVQLGNYAYLAGIAGINESGGVIENCAVINTSLTRRFGHSHARAAIVHTNNGTVENCFAYGCTYNNDNATNGGIISAGTAPINCYYYTTATVATTYGTAMAAEQFASGEVAWLLNGESDQGVWGQTIGTDPYPTATGETVYQYTACDGTTVKYTNDSNLSGKTADHAYTNGFCTGCKKCVIEIGDVTLSEVDGVKYYSVGGETFAYEGTLVFSGSTEEYGITVVSGTHDVEFKGLTVNLANHEDGIPLKLTGGSLNLTLTDENRLTGYNNNNEITGGTEAILIGQDCTLTVTADSTGNLSLHGCNGDNNYTEETPFATWDAINGPGNLIINGGTLSTGARGTGIGISGALTVNGGSVDVGFLAAANVTIHGGNVTTTGLVGDMFQLEHAGGTHGIYASGNVTITGGTVYTKANVGCIGTSSMAVLETMQTHGICAGGTVTITGGTVTAIGNPSAYNVGDMGDMVMGYCVGGYGIYAETIRITGGNVKAEGTAPKEYVLDDEQWVSEGVDANYVTNVTPVNGDDKALSCNAITLEGVSEVTAISAIVGAEGYGLKDVTTLDGVLYLWLPEAPIAVKVGETFYEGTVTDGTGTFTVHTVCTKYEGGNCVVCGTACDHTGETPTYEITTQTHTAQYPCGYVGQTEEHSFEAENGYACSVCGEVQSFTLTWKVGDETVYTETVKYGSSITAPDSNKVTVPEAYYSVKWDSYPGTMPAENVTVAGGYWTVYVSFYSEDGTFISFKQYAVGTELYLNPSSNLINAYKEGYTAYFLNTVDGQKYKIESDGLTHIWPTVTLNGNMNLKPVYELNTYSVTFGAGEGSGTMDSASAQYGATYTLPENTLTPPEGYHFKGWSIGGTEYAVGAQITVTGNVTVEAVWESHSYEAGAYVWNEEYTACIMTGTCTCGKTATATATIASEQTKDPTCTEKGETTYTATFTEDWAETQTKTVANVSVLGHDWSVSYSWSDDGKTCTATRTCGNDASHNVTVDASITSTESKAPGCVTMGDTTYTATFEVDWAEGQNKTLKDIPATGEHSYTEEVEGTQIDATCMKSGSVTMRCSDCDAAKVQTIEKDASNHTGKTTVTGKADATCGEAGYTGDTVCECGVTVTKGEIIPATGEHSYTEEVEGTQIDATCMKSGSVTMQCSDCDAAKVQTIEKDASNHTGKTTVTGKGDATCGEAGYTGDTVCECGVTVTKGEIIPATGEHSFSTEWSFDEAYHWHGTTCGHDAAKDLHTHFGGNATTEVRAICADCGQPYGELVVPSEIEKKIEELKEAVCEFDKETVNADDLEVLMQIVADAQTLIDSDHITEEERTALEAVKVEAEALLEIIEGKESDTPVTGDPSDIMLWIVPMLISALAMAVLVIGGKKRTNRK